jgi:hypothetical protein
MLGAGGGEQYLLRDDFSDTLAAGSVNGTLAVPGPGTRAVVTDTESKVSLSGGKLVFAGGKAAPAYGDPGLWYGVITRVPGLMMLSQITPDNNIFMMGLDTNQSGVSGGVDLRWATGFLCRGSAPALCAYTPGATYKIAIAIRTAGYFVLVKGGIYTNWSLMFIDIVQA